MQSYASCMQVLQGGNNTCKTTMKHSPETIWSLQMGVFFLSRCCRAQIKKQNKKKQKNNQGQVSNLSADMVAEVPSCYRKCSVFQTVWNWKVSNVAGSVWLITALYNLMAALSDPQVLNYTSLHSRLLCGFGCWDRKAPAMVIDNNLWCLNCKAQH